MNKVKKAFFCSNCGAEHSKWQGQCNSCKSWNTLVEEIIKNPNKKEWKNIEIPGYSWDENLNTYQEGLKLSAFIKNKSHKIQKKLEKIIN